jgi:hypothetical protein
MTLRSTAVTLARRLHVEGPARAALRTIRPPIRFARALTTRVARIPGELAATARWTTGIPSRLRFARAYRDILAARIDFEEFGGSPADDALAVVVCLWNRPGRLVDVLRILDSQITTRPLRLVLWNNREADADHYRRVLTGYAPTGALASVEFHTSGTNIGGMARFVAMRELVRRGYRGSFLMMDDDEDFTASFVDDLMAVSAPRAISSIWAWRNDGAYWNRVQIEATGEPANHLGTGGCVCDSDLVANEQFFTRIPLRYLFMEDMWMTHCAIRSGWTLRMVASPVHFVLAEFDQGHAIYDHKEDFFSWLKDERRIPLLASGSATSSERRGSRPI